jgi:translation elongation factor EF-G
MPDVLSGTNEPDQSDPELAIAITIPEEFVGFAMGELSSRSGVVTGMKIVSRTVVIYASLRASENHGLEQSIAETTRQRGKVVRGRGSAG